MFFHSTKYIGKRFAGNGSRRFQTICMRCLLAKSTMLSLKCNDVIFHSLEIRLIASICNFPRIARRRTFKCHIGIAIDMFDIGWIKCHGEIEAANDSPLSFTAVGQISLFQIKVNDCALWNKPYVERIHRLFPM